MWTFISWSKNLYECCQYVLVIRIKKNIWISLIIMHNVINNVRFKRLNHFKLYLMVSNYQISCHWMKVTFTIFLRMFTNEILIYKIGPNIARIVTKLREAKISCKSLFFFWLQRALSKTFNNHSKYPNKACDSVIWWSKTWRVYREFWKLIFL